ncbi:MAG TPA: hypothetical protein PK292_08765 [Termitinemataceae bacterium]|nr:hypothetical protein [Termitinemataceae bacterium]
MNVQQLLGAFLVIIAVLIGILTYQGSQIEAFHTKGQPVTAKILQKYTLERSKLWGNPAVSRYSRMLQREYYFDVTLNTALSAAGKALQFVSAPLVVSPELGATLTKDSTIEVLYLAENPTETVIAREDFLAGRHSLDGTTKKRYAEEAKVSRAQVRKILENGKVEIYFSASNVSAAISPVKLPMPVDGSMYKAYEVGDTIDVVYLPGNEDRAISVGMLKSLIYLPTWLGALVTVAVACLGGWLLFLKK